ncbi:hypothetical protein A7K93_10510 [Candidatus Methylacidiphilum fumarolicum]|nr:hypothetical protein A7K73_09715 [Candidatus Methylacidiphilum fumarolicum]TFE71643.1 hypothetical protein A7K93_10510 [Candidatus Methylacidiphilum fumarolicum]TFE73219.1 hypothetical protein A7K72_07090 [Candidatus Methylacidiphilum fumarolicum]
MPAKRTTTNWRYYPHEDYLRVIDQKATRAPHKHLHKSFQRRAKEGSEGSAASSGKVLPDSKQHGGRMAGGLKAADC